MTILQPKILWGQPLVLLPVMVHMNNRIRHAAAPLRVPIPGRVLANPTGVTR